MAHKEEFLSSAALDPLSVGQPVSLRGGRLRRKGPIGGGGRQQGDMGEHWDGAGEEGRDEEEGRVEKG